MRKRKLFATAAAVVSLVGAVGCGSDSGGKDSAGGGGGGGAITMGFSQVGAESGWRAANTKSIQTAAKEAGVKLNFSDGQQKQENQIKAIRSYIQQRVDVIAFSPVVETGWDAVLNEAKRSKIPVILTDRAVDSADEGLYASFLGSDFEKEGEKAGAWAVKEFEGDDEVRVVELQGTAGSAPAIDRKKGFETTTSPAGKFQLVESQDGDFTRAKGKEVMESILKKTKDIDLLYAHNDDMALGAIEAIEGAGLKPGEDIKILSIDAVKDGMTALSEGKINYIVECSPLLGPQLMDLAKKVAAGESVPRRVETKESEFDQDQAKQVLASRQY
jgi:simple sugar transport system substrate-binding protein